MRILRWIQMDQQSDQTPSRYDVSSALSKLQADLCLIPVTNAPSTNAAGIFGVILPRFMPTRQSEAEYKAECEKVLSRYISRELRAHTAEGLNKPKPLRAEERHLNWLSWMLVEKLTSFEVAVRQEKETPTKSKNDPDFVPDDDKVEALFKPGGLATVIGLSRN